MRHEEAGAHHQDHIHAMLCASTAPPPTHPTPAACAAQRTCRSGGPSSGRRRSLLYTSCAACISHTARSLGAELHTAGQKGNLPSAQPHAI